MSRFKRWWDWSSYQWTLCSWWHLRTEMPRWLHQIQFLWLKDQVKEVIISWFTGAFFFKVYLCFFMPKKSDGWEYVSKSIENHQLKFSRSQDHPTDMFVRNPVDVHHSEWFRLPIGYLAQSLVGKVSTQILKSWFRNLRFQSLFTLLMVQKSGHHQFIRTRFHTCQVVIAGFLPSTVLFCILSPPSSMYTCVAMGTETTRLRFSHLFKQHEDWDYGTFICGDSPCDISGVAASIKNLKEASTEARTKWVGHLVKVIGSMDFGWYDVDGWIRNPIPISNTPVVNSARFQLPGLNWWVNPRFLVAISEETEVISACQEGDIIPSGATCTPNCKWPGREFPWN